MNEKLSLLKNAHNTLDGLKNLSKGKKLSKIISLEVVISNNYFRRKGFISTLNARFVWQHFVHIAKKG